MVIFTSSQATQNKVVYEREKVSTPKDAHGQGRADLKSSSMRVPNADVREDGYSSLSRMQPPAGMSGSRQKLCPLTHAEGPDSPHSHPQRGRSFSDSGPDPQSLLSPSAATTGLNPKCILHTQHSCLIFTATCSNSSLSRHARQTGTQESGTSLGIISRPSSASVEHQIY